MNIFSKKIINKIVVVVLCAVALITSPAQTVMGKNINDGKAPKDKVVDAYDKINDFDYVEIQYQEESEDTDTHKWYLIEIDHKNRIKRIVRIDNYSFNAAQKDQNNDVTYIDYEKEIKYHNDLHFMLAYKNIGSSDEHPQKNKSSEEGESKRENDIESKESTDLEWLNETNDIDSRKIGEIESIVNDKVEYIGIKKIDDAKEIDSKDGKETVIRQETEEGTYKYTIDNSGNLILFEKRSKEKDLKITMSFICDNETRVNIPKDYLDEDDESAEDSQLSNTEDKEVEDNEVTTEILELEESSKKIKSDSLYIIILILVAFVLIIAIIATIIIKKKMRREIRQPNSQEKNKVRRGITSISQDKTDGEELNDIKESGREERVINVSEYKQQNAIMQESGMSEIYKLRFIVTGKDKKKEEIYYELKRGESVIVGRSDMSSVVIEDPTLSRQHFILSSEDEYLYIEDLDTTNGTSVNGKKIEGRTLIAQRDTISAGNYDIRIDW